MAKETYKGITIEIDANTNGVTESLKDINKELNSTQKELRTVDKMLKEDGDNTQLLAQKQQLLTNAIDETTSKLVRLARYKAEADKDDSIDKNTKEYRELERNIISTQQALDKLNDEYKSNQDAMNGVSSDIKKVSDAMDEAGQSGLQFGDILKANVLGDLIINGIKSLANAIVEVGQAMYNTLRESGRFADDVNTMAKQFNLSTEEIQGYLRASELIDVSVETIAKSMSKLTKNMTSTSKETLGAFETLGIAVKDNSGALRDSNDVFYETIEALAKVTNETEQDNLALQIFGKSASDLGPLINGGVDELNKLTSALKKNSLILNQNELDSLNKMNDGFDTLDTTISAFKDKMSSQFAPTITPILDSIIEKTNEFINNLIDGAGAEALVIDSLNDSLVESIATTNDLYNQKVLNYDLGLREVELLQKYIDKFSDANITEEQSIAYKDRLRLGVNNLNEALGTTYYLFDEQRGVITDTNGKVVDLEQSYKSLGEATRQALWIETHKEEYVNAMNSIETATKENQDAVTKYTEKIAEMGEVGSIAMEQYTNKASEYWQYMKSNWTDEEAGNRLKAMLGTDTIEQAMLKVADLGTYIDGVNTSSEKLKELEKTAGDVITTFETLSTTESSKFDEIWQNVKDGFGTVYEITDNELPLLTEKIKTTQEQLDSLKSNTDWTQNEAVQTTIADLQEQLDGYKSVYEQITGEIYQMSSDTADSVDEKVETSMENTKKSTDKAINGEGGVKPTLLAFQQWWAGVNLDKTIHITVDYSQATSSAMNGGYGGSGGFGGSLGFGDAVRKIMSGGYSSGGITLNNVINVNNNGQDITSDIVNDWADIMTDRINHNLGRLI